MECIKTDEETKKEYEQYVEQVTPRHNLPAHMLRAFVTGGLICALGQFILNFCADRGIPEKEAAAWCSLLLIALSALLTGLNLYQRLVTFGGAGALVPITGFANSVAAPAIEYKKEGQVFGVGAKIFTIAGPVILYGIFTSWILGILFCLLERSGLYWV